MLTSCIVGPNYHRPYVQIPKDYKERDHRWKVASPQDDYDHGMWWTVFNEPELNDLEDILNHCNFDILTAKANFKEAALLIKRTRAKFFPTMSTVLSYISQEKKPTPVPLYSLGPFANYGENLSQNPLSLLASWEPDIWGKVIREVESRRGKAQAQFAEIASVRLLAQASLAQYYFELRTVDADQYYLDYLASNYGILYKIYQKAYLTGYKPDVAAITAESQWEIAKSLADENHILRENYEHAIAVLIGKPPAEVRIPVRPLNKEPPPIPVAIPSVLLERRPDIAVAEREMLAANALIGVAIAPYFPVLDILANTGFLTSSFPAFLSSNAFNFAVGPSLVQWVYDAGYRKANTAAARAHYEATVQSYRQTVLAGFRDVEDKMAQLEYLNVAATRIKRAQKDAELNYKLYKEGYKSGTQSYAELLVALNVALNAEKSTADINGLRMSVAAALIKSLGGGWSTAYIPNFVDPILPMPKSTPK